VSVEAEAPERRHPARLLIADDHELVRSGFRLMLESEPDLEVVGEASNGREAVELCRRLMPDIVLMDVRMPEMDGLEATRAIKRQQPRVAVLMVTTYEDPDYLLRAIKEGAAGYLLKNASSQQLTNAIRRVLDGEAALNQELAIQLIQRLSSEVSEAADQPPSPDKGPDPTPPLENLTHRELEVLQLLSQGKSNPQIAQELFISAGTVKVHVRNISSKLGVSDRTQAVVHAIELGLVVAENRR
jgi:two-component system, NarL family, response regulator LiaR